MRQKIAIVANQIESAINFRGPLIKHMADLGHLVQVYVPEPRDVLRCNELVNLGARAVIPVPMDRCGNNPLHDCATTLALKTEFSEWRPDVVLTTMIKPIIYGTAAAIMAGVQRRFAMVEGAGYVMEDGKSPTKILARKMYGAAIKRNAKTFFMNSDNINDFVSANMVNEEQAVLLPGGIGVDLEYYNTTTPLPRGPFTFVMIARLLAAKGVREYMRAATQLRETEGFDNVRFVLLGGQDDNPTAIPFRDVQRCPHVEHWPEVQDVRPVIEQSNVFVLPSYHEGMPRTTLEAMAMGRPIITTYVAGCRETVRQGINGLLVKPRNATDLANAMRSMILRDRYMVQAMGHASRALAVERFDVRRANEKICGEMGLESD